MQVAEHQIGGCPGQHLERFVGAPGRADAGSKRWPGKEAGQRLLEERLAVDQDDSGSEVTAPDWRAAGLGHNDHDVECRGGRP